MRDMTQFGMEEYMMFEPKTAWLRPAKVRLCAAAVIFALVHIMLAWLLHGALSKGGDPDLDAVAALGVVVSAGFWCSTLYQIHVLCKNGNTALVDKMLISQFPVGCLMAVTYSALLFFLVSGLTRKDGLIHSLVFCTDIGLCHSTAKFYAKAQF